MITEYKHTLNIQQCFWSNTQGNQFIHQMQNISLTCHWQFSSYILLNAVYYLGSLGWIHSVLGTIDRQLLSCLVDFVRWVTTPTPYAFFTLHFKFWKYVLLVTISFVSFCFTLAFNPLIAVVLPWYGTSKNDLHSKLIEWFLCGWRRWQ